MGKQDEYMREELFAKTGIKTEELAEGELAVKATLILNVLLTDCSVMEIHVDEVNDASLKQMADCYVSLISYDDPHPELFFSEYYVNDEAKKFYHVKEASLFTLPNLEMIRVTVDKSATFRRSEIEAGLAALQGMPLYVGTKRVNQAICKVGGTQGGARHIRQKGWGYQKDHVERGWCNA